MKSILHILTPGVRKGEHIVLDKFDRVIPVSTLFGYNQGQPVDRYYIVNFVSQHKDIHGRAWGIGNNVYQNNSVVAELSSQMSYMQLREVTGNIPFLL